MTNMQSQPIPERVVLMDEVRAIVANVIERKPDEITPDGSLPDEYDVTSLLGLEVLVALQRRYKVKIPESMMQEMTTIRGITEMLQRYVDEPITV